MYLFLKINVVFISRKKSKNKTSKNLPKKVNTYCVIYRDVVFLVLMFLTTETDNINIFNIDMSIRMRM